ncbi:MAG: pilus assembly protein [Alphaproteobacteria bacterium]|nr:pilus assembly protein [Alphaproteobacteria bacterium]
MRETDGAVLVEMAVVIPMLATLGFGTLEFGYYFYDRQIIESGLRDGARYAAGRPYNPSNATQTAQVISDAKNIATTGTNSGGTPRLSWWTTTNVTVAYSTVANPNTCGTGNTQACYRYSGSVPLVTVSTSVTYPQLGFLGVLGLSDITIATSHQERVIGVR